jgi:hypothetical protein
MGLPFSVTKSRMTSLQRLSELQRLLPTTSPSSRLPKLNRVSMTPKDLGSLLIPRLEACSA